MDPKKKKQQSLEHDCVNTYGENDKSSRKAIRFRKRSVNQGYRRAVNQSLKSPDLEAAQEHVQQVRRVDWKKSPDEPLGISMRNNLVRKLRTHLQRSPSASIILELIEQKLHDDGWTPQAVRVVMRQCQSIAMDPNSSELGIDLETARKLVSVLAEIALE